MKYSSHRKPTQESFLPKSGGFTLVEIMVVVVITGLLALIASYNLSKHMNDSRRNTTMANIKILRGGIALYGLELGDHLPTDLDELVLENDDEPTVSLTNQRRRSSKHLITRYAKRMLVGNASSDEVRFFHMDALSAAVGLKADFDMALLVITSGLYRSLAQRMRGYAQSQARQIFRDLIDMPANVTISSPHDRQTNRRSLVASNEISRYLYGMSQTHTILLGGLSQRHNQG